MHLTAETSHSCMYIYVHISLQDVVPRDTLLEHMHLQKTHVSYITTIVLFSP